MQSDHDTSALNRHLSVFCSIACTKLPFPATGKDDNSSWICRHRPAWTKMTRVSFRHCVKLYNLYRQPGSKPSHFLTEGRRELVPHEELRHSNRTFWWFAGLCVGHKWTREQRSQDLSVLSRRSLSSLRFGEIKILAVPTADVEIVQVCGAGHLLHTEPNSKTRSS